MHYHGQCHCGAIKYQFESEEITHGLRCNCSICIRKGALMTAFVVASDNISINAADGALATYQFGSKTAHHHFCNQCGIYTFHQVSSKPGHYRLNIGCIEGIDATKLPFDVFDGASL